LMFQNEVKNGKNCWFFQFNFKYFWLVMLVSNRDQ
jgi:hypothetical protein